MVAALSLKLALNGVLERITSLPLLDIPKSKPMVYRHVHLAIPKSWLLNIGEMGFEETVLVAQVVPRLVSTRGVDLRCEQRRLFFFLHRLIRDLPRNMATYIKGK